MKNVEWIQLVGGHFCCFSCVPLYCGSSLQDSCSTLHCLPEIGSQWC